MFSGKTSMMMQRIERYKVAGKRCVVIKYADDTRYDTEKCATHNKHTCDAVAAKRLSSVNFACAGKEGGGSGSCPDVIGIDEGQFFPDIVKYCNDIWAERDGKIVIVAALDGDWNRKPFQHIMNLIPYCEIVVKLDAVCMGCNAINGAAFSARRVTAPPIGECQIDIGGEEKYEALCRQCYCASKIVGGKTKSQPALK
jgi:thymidine kinase